MIRITSLLGIVLLLIVGCQAKPEITAEVNDPIIFRVAFLGDAEPKPLAEFPNMNAAVEQINAFTEYQQMDFVIGVGDIAHKGTEIQYEAATPIIQKLRLPFYPIMGNEEHNSSVERYLFYARQWNPDLDTTRYVLEYEQFAFVLASPDSSREFTDDGVRWVLEQLQRLSPKPVFLVVHGAQQGVYEENPDKGISNTFFKEQVISQTNLLAVVSGDLHMDMDRVNHSKRIGNVHYLHIPALERTKIPDETNHTPMIRLMSITESGKVVVETYVVGNMEPNPKHRYEFRIEG